MSFPRTINTWKGIFIVVKDKINSRYTSTIKKKLMFVKDRLEVFVGVMWDGAGETHLIMILFVNPSLAYLLDLGEKTSVVSRK